jgi:hypothetical protein
VSYQWRQGIQHGGVKADVAGAELERIRDDHDGRLEAPMVVVEARPKDAALHPAFEWDDKKAAEEYRINQARRIIRAIRIVGPESQPSDEPAYVHIKRVDGEVPYYQSARVAITNQDEWALAVEEVGAKFRSAGRALHDLERIANVKDKKGMVSLITVANRALTTAQQAIDKISA